MAFHQSKTSKFLVLLTLFLLLFTACGEKKVTTINPKQSFSFTYKGGKLSLASHKPFMLFFLSRSCGVCSEQIKELKGLGGILQLGVINDAKDEADARSILKEKKLLLPLVYKRREVRFLSEAVGGVSGVPVIYLYDSLGKQRAKFLGLTPRGLIQRNINRL